MIDIIIAGGGASGIMAALSAKMQNPALSVTVLEKQNRPLKKLLATGNGRCNMLNLNPLKENFHGTFTDMAMSVIKKADPELIISLFSEVGLSVTKRYAPLIYPASMQASSVREALLTACYERGVKIFSDFEITDISHTEYGFDIINKKCKVLSCKKLILSGGTSAGGTHTKMHELIKSLGHKTNDYYPALVPLCCKEKDVLKIADGARAYARLKLLCGGEVIKEDSGEVQFCWYGLSGIVTMQLSGYAVKLINEGKKPEICVCLYDDFDEIYNRLIKDKRAFNKISVHQRLCFLVNSAVSQMILKIAGIKEDTLLSALSETDIKKVCSLLCTMRFTPTSAKGEEFAQVFGGGAESAQFDENLCSKINPDLYLTGEILDIYGDCGGYNLTWAWASGYVAGSSAAKALTTHF